MASADLPWQPSRILRVVGAFPTGSSVVRVETDQGEGFLKALSNKAEPHNLACELVGTQLARWLKLPTLDFAVIRIAPNAGIELADKSFAHPGPAFITRFEDGYPWSGDVADLDRLENPEDLARLVVFDTWTRNCDRYLPREGGARVNRDNVFLSRRGASNGRIVLKAIDQGCCFTCGRELTVRLRDLDNVQDSRLYGRFPELAGRVSQRAALRIVEEVEAIERTEVQSLFGRSRGNGTWASAFRRRGATSSASGPATFERRSFASAHARCCLTSQARSHSHEYRHRTLLDHSILSRSVAPGGRQRWRGPVLPGTELPRRSHGQGRRPHPPLLREEGPRSGTTA